MTNFSFDLIPASEITKGMYLNLDGRWHKITSIFKSDRLFGTVGISRPLLFNFDTTNVGVHTLPKDLIQVAFKNKD